MYLSDHGPLSCFPLGAIMNNAFTRMQVSVWLYLFISLGCIPRSEIAGPCGNSWTFWETAMLFPKGAAPFYIPTSKVGRFWFLYILPILLSFPGNLHVYLCLPTPQISCHLCMGCTSELPGTLIRWCGSCVTHVVSGCKHCCLFPPVCCSNVIFSLYYDV